MDSENNLCCSQTTPHEAIRRLLIFFFFDRLDISIKTSVPSSRTARCLRAVCCGQIRKDFAIYPGGILVRNAKTMGARKKQTETTGTQPMEEKPMRGAS